MRNCSLKFQYVPLRHFSSGRFFVNRVDKNIKYPIWENSYLPDEVPLKDDWWLNKFSGAEKVLQKKNSFFLDLINKASHKNEMSIFDGIAISGTIKQLTRIIPNFPAARFSEDSVDILCNLMMERFVDFHEAVVALKDDSDLNKSNIATSAATLRWSVEIPKHAKNATLEPHTGQIRGILSTNYPGVNNQSFIVFLEVEADMSFKTEATNSISKKSVSQKLAQQHNSSNQQISNNTKQFVSKRPNQSNETDDAPLKRTRLPGLPQFIKVYDGSVESKSLTALVAFEFAVSVGKERTFVFRVADIHTLDEMLDVRSDMRMKEVENKTDSQEGKNKMAGLH